jgi:hypothetical protein
VCSTSRVIGQDTVTVDNTKMGAYRALAQLSYDAFKRGDSATAATLARILERTWDKGETDLDKSNPDVWKQIDGSMDGFIKPVMRYMSKTPDPAEVKMAFDTYLTKLGLAN